MTLLVKNKVMGVIQTNEHITQLFSKENPTLLKIMSAPGG